jgi:hypothetical protein
MNSPMVILLVGEPKSGKTVSASTFPKPMVVFDFDNGGWKSTDAFLGEEEKSQIEVLEFRKEETYDLQFKTIQKGPAPSHSREANTLMQKFNTKLNHIPEGTETVVIDSASAMFRLWKEAILLMNGQASLQIQDYMTLENILYNQFIPSLKALPVKYVILIAHVTIEKDELSGVIREFPLGPSRNMGKTIAQDFDEVWKQEYDEYAGEWNWRTKKEGLFTGAGSRANFPDPMPAHFDSVIKHLGL